MPKPLDNLIGQLEETLKKIEYALEDYGAVGDDVLSPLSDSIDALVEINNELDSDLEEE